MTTMSGGFIQQTHRINHDSTRKSLVHHLMTVVKDLQRKYGGKTELATEEDHNVLKLCDSWEYVLCHGLRTGSLLRNVSDLVSGANQEPPVFWTFAFQHMTAHEKERFTSLRHVWTDRGKCRAFIRAALNERSLERYILMWLADTNIAAHYESWALVRDEESANLLPTLAAGLSSILFAITVDSPALNVHTRRELKTEPIIAVPHPVRPQRRGQRHQVIEFDEAGLSISPVAVGTLASLCLKHETVPTARVHMEPHKAPKTPEEAFNVPEEFPKCIPDDIFTPPSDSGIVVEEHTSEGSLDDESSLRSTSKSSSMHSSSSSVVSDVTHLRERLRQAEERCQMLEARVAELSLENHRLRGQHTTSTFTISVPRARLEKTGKISVFNLTTFLYFQQEPQLASLTLSSVGSRHLEAKR